MEADLSSKHVGLDKKYRKYVWGYRVGLLLVYGGLLVFVVAALFFPSPVRSLPDAVRYSGGFAMIFAGAYVWNVTLNMPLEERLFVRVYDIMSKLNRYISDTSRRRDKKKALKRLRGVVNLVEAKWILNFKLAERVLPIVNSFKHTLEENLVYTIEQDNLTNIGYALQHLGRFARFLTNDQPTVSELEEVDRFMRSLPHRPYEKGRIQRFWLWVSQPTIRSAFPLILGLFSGPILFAMSTAYGIPISVALAPSVVASVGFPGAWLAYLNLKKK